MSKIFWMKTKLPANKMCSNQNIFVTLTFDSDDFLSLVGSCLCHWINGSNVCISMEEHTLKFLNKKRTFHLIRITAAKDQTKSCIALHKTLVTIVSSNGQKKIVNGVKFQSNPFHVIYSNIFCLSPFFF